MIRTYINWLESKPFERQILLLALTLDPIGFAAGYLLAPSFGIEPLFGGLYRKYKAKTHGFSRGMKPTTGNQTTLQ